MEKYYFDSGVFITPILKNREDKIIEKCIYWLKRISKGEILAFTSYLTWDEIVYIVRKLYSVFEGIKAGEIFLSLPNLQFINVEENIIKNAQEFVEKYHINPRDSIHASSALRYTDANLITLDVDSSDFKKLKDKNGNLLLNIEEII